MKGLDRMMALKQFGLVLLILWTGQSIQKITGISIPGNVLGMMILLILLVSGLLPASKVEKAADVLLEHLSFLFIPVSVGVMTVAHLLRGNIVSLMILALTSLVVVMVATAWTVQWMIRRKEAKGGGESD